MTNISARKRRSIREKRATTETRVVTDGTAAESTVIARNANLAMKAPTTVTEEMNLLKKDGTIRNIAAVIVEVPVLTVFGAKKVAKAARATDCREGTTESLGGGAPATVMKAIEVIVVRGRNITEDPDDAAIVTAVEVKEMVKGRDLKAMQVLVVAAIAGTTERASTTKPADPRGRLKQNSPV